MEILPDHKRARAEFERLSREEVADAVANMLSMGFSEATVSHATGLSIEYIRQTMAARREART
ncbi:MAG: hypothetical protein WD795_18135 [Woeseia sp.]